MLAVTVSRGDSVAKSNVAKKLHQTYETTLRIVENSPSAIRASGRTSHAVAKVFDGYRALFTELKELGYFANAEFPRTFTRSSFGVGLGEDNLRERCLMLNNWMEELLSRFSILSIPIQAVVLSFLQLEDETMKKALKPAEKIEEEFEIIVDSSKLNEKINQDQSTPLRMVAMLKEGKVVTAAELLQRTINTRLVVSQAPESGDLSELHPLTAHVRQQASGNEETVRDDDQDSSKAESDHDEVGELVAFKNGTNVGEAGHYHSRQSTGVRSIVSSGEGALNRGEMMIEPVIIRENLAISVVRSLPMAKKDGQKKHPTYLATLQVVGSRRTYGPCLKQGFFETYRNLAEDLFQEGVSDNQDSKFVIGSPFPRTHSRSKFGIALSDNLLHQRCWNLHNWMIALLSIYPSLPEKAKDIINVFFALDDNPAEPQNGAILAILDDKWVSMNAQEKAAARDVVLNLPKELEEDGEIREISDQDAHLPIKGCCIVM